MPPVIVSRQCQKSIRTQPSQCWIINVYWEEGNKALTWELRSSCDDDGNNRARNIELIGWTKKNNRAARAACVWKDFNLHFLARNRVSFSHNTAASQNSSALAIFLRDSYYQVDIFLGSVCDKCKIRILSFTGRITKELCSLFKRDHACESIFMMEENKIPGQIRESGWDQLTPAKICEKVWKIPTKPLGLINHGAMQHGQPCFNAVEQSWTSRNITKSLFVAGHTQNHKQWEPTKDDGEAAWKNNGELTNWNLNINQTTHCVSLHGFI